MNTQNMSLILNKQTKIKENNNFAVRKFLPSVRFFYRRYNKISELNTPKTMYNNLCRHV